MTDKDGIFILGVFVGILATSTGLLLLANCYTPQSIEECQKDLPRSQKCVLIAVPEVKK